MSDLVDLIALAIAVPLTGWFITGCVFFPIRLIEQLTKES